jgi:hypothetical protein
MGTLKKGIKIQGARMYVLVEDGVNTAKIIDLGKASRNEDFTGVSETKTDITVTSDDVSNTITTAVDQGSMTFECVPDSDVNTGEVLDLLEQFGNAIRVFVAFPDGTVAPPTAPTLAGGVLSWTIPTTPAPFTFLEFAASGEASTIKRPAGGVMTINCSVKVNSTIKFTIKGGAKIVELNKF